MSSTDILIAYAPQLAPLATLIVLLSTLFFVLNTSQSLADLALEWLVDGHPQTRFDRQFRKVKDILFGDGFFSWRRQLAILFIYVIAFGTLAIGLFSGPHSDDELFLPPTLDQPWAEVFHGYSIVYFATWLSAPLQSAEAFVISYVVGLTTFSTSEQWLWKASKLTGKQKLARFGGCILLSVLGATLFFVFIVAIFEHHYEFGQRMGTPTQVTWQLLKSAALRPFCRFGNPSEDPNDLCSQDSGLLVDVFLLTSVMATSILFLSPVINLVYVSALALGKSHVFLYYIWNFKQGFIAKYPVLYCGVVLVFAVIILYLIGWAVVSML